MVARRTGSSYLQHCNLLLCPRTERQVFWDRTRGNRRAYQRQRVLFRKSLHINREVISNMVSSHVSHCVPQCHVLNRFQDCPQINITHREYDSVTHAQLQNLSNNVQVESAQNLASHACASTRPVRQGTSISNNYLRTICKGYLSIRQVYARIDVTQHLASHALINARHASHFLGYLDHTCIKCNAKLWKGETRKRLSEVVGTHCCRSGKVSLLELHDPPEVLADLLRGHDAKSKNFRKNIRAFNSVLSFTSLGAYVNESLSRGGGVYTFRVHGCMYHRIGSLLPTTDQPQHTPRFAQLYVYDTEHEIENRLNSMPNLDREVIRALQEMMHSFNPYASAFRSMGELIRDNPHVDLTMVICDKRPTARQYIAPTAMEVAAIMPGQGDGNNDGHRDIQIHPRDGTIRKISNLHRAYMPLMYVLLFPRGEDGWQLGMPFSNSNHIEESEEKCITQRQYYAYRLQIRRDTNACLLRGGRLLQQYMVDCFSSMEESRLNWIKKNQLTLRSEVYQGLADMVSINESGDNVPGTRAGRRIVLPSSFTGGPRHMHQLYQDAMSIVRKRGKPDLFITFTCNPKWIEISDALLAGQGSPDRPDITSRVFHQKQKDLMDLLINKCLFGKVVGYVSVIEFQKRGLPHSHILLILEEEFKPIDISHYDRLVCAELPDQGRFAELYEIIKQCNLHGPCGVLCPSAPCMVDGKCGRKYPRRFTAATVVGDDGYPIYMRRDDGRKCQVKGCSLDNRWVVPYNPFLSLRYKAHINIEICSTISAVKYLYKYVYKGHDRATVVLRDSNTNYDEVKEYLDARYVSASEACWRLFEYELHQEKPDIQRLQVHLPSENNVIFQDTDDIRNIVNNDNVKKTTLTEWFVANERHEDAHTVTYADFPSKWVWNAKDKLWTKRKRGNVIGRMYNILPSAGELYYLRTLLGIVKGCKSFDDLRTFNRHVYPTFKAACVSRGLLESDEEWMTCMQEATLSQNSLKLRQLFVMILVFCEPIAPGALWNKFSDEMSDDYYFSLGAEIPVINMRRSIASNSALLQVHYMLQQYGKTLRDFAGMPSIDRSMTSGICNGLLLEETMFDIGFEMAQSAQMQGMLNDCQRSAFNQIMLAISQNEGGVFFVDGPGGSGKTFLYNCLLSTVRGQREIALAVASSGIAALLLSKGRTAHSRFKIPLELNATSTCNIKVNSDIAEVLQKCSLIIWDEAPMTHRYAFEALDRTMQDIMRNNVLFGGKVVLFGGDFRQVLPVIPKASREMIVDAALCHSRIWMYTKVLRLLQNMRVQNALNSVSEIEFVQWILDIGNGNACAAEQEGEILLPSKMSLEQKTVQGLVDWVFQGLDRLQDHANFFKDRAILAPRNREVQDVNDFALNMMRGDEHEYLSADSVVSDGHDNFLYATEYLNSLDLGGGFPPHRLMLKQGAPIILLRNLDPKNGLCNGTRLICKHFHSKVLEAEIITGRNVGNCVFLPRITFIPSSIPLPFTMRRRQFPVKLAFAMTINKSQGQTLSVLGLYLATPVFSHGQLYVAMSRVRSSDAIKVLLHSNDSQCTNTSSTVNVVYKEVLQSTSNTV